MEASLTAATKLHALPSFFDRLNAIGSPSVAAFSNSGEGSSFLALPTKRNFQPIDTTKINANNQSLNATGASDSYLDFKSALVPLIWKAVAPQQDARPAIDGTSLPSTTSFGAAASSSRLFESAKESNDFTQQEWNSFHQQAGKSLVPPSIPKKDDMLKSPLMPTEQQWYQMNQLRIQSGAPERTENGIEKLMHYYAQLCWLEDKFPFDTDKVPLEFCWFEAFFPKKQGILNRIDIYIDASRHVVSAVRKGVRNVERWRPLFAAGSHSEPLDTRRFKAGRSILSGTLLFIT
jgi:hypothetical protein